MSRDIGRPFSHVLCREVARLFAGGGGLEGRNLLQA
jgi:hypothetical protein